MNNKKQVVFDTTESGGKEESMRKTRLTKNIAVPVMAVMIMLFCSFASHAKIVGVYILPNKTWTSDSDNTDSRSGDHSTVYARCHSVYPESGTDNFTTIWCRVTNGYGRVISDQKSLNESASASSEIKIKEGELSTRFVGFQFRGNTNASANSTVSYDGR